MKRRISGILMILCVIFVSFACVRQTVVVAQPKKDNGQHKGWYKNPKNPHHPDHARNAGGNRTTVVINNSNSNRPQSNHGNAHVQAKPGNGHNKSQGNASKGNGGGNGKAKGNGKK